MKKKIIELIQSDEIDIADVNGEKPLLRLANLLRKDNSKAHNDEVLLQLKEIDIPSLSAIQINSYLSFIYYAELFDDSIYRKLKDDLQRKFKEIDDDTVLKRSLLLRFIVNNFKNKILLPEVLSEETVRNKLPWIWSDIVSVYSWNLAEEEIGKIISSGDKLENLILRLPHFITRIDKEQLTRSFIKWYSNTINKNQRAILQKWAKSFKITVGPSISAEASLSNIPLFQESII